MIIYRTEENDPISNDVLFVFLTTGSLNKWNIFVAIKI